MRARSVLVVAQVALTLPLLVGAAALTRSYAALTSVDSGFRANDVLSLHMAIPRPKYPSDAEIADLYQRIVEHVAAVPGIASAGMVNRLPLTGNNQVTSVAFAGIAGEPLTLQSRSVTPGYFSTIGIPLRQGRVFTERDTADAPLVGIVDDRLARTLWPGESPIGKRFAVTLPGQTTAAAGEIVGIVGSIRHQGLDSSADRQIYFNYRQFTDGRIALVARSRTDARAITAAVVQAIRTVDPEQPVYNVRTMDEVRAQSTADRRLNTAILAVFAASALLLAGVGLYGVIAYGVAQRTREFGLRIALGALPSEVSRLVLRQGSALAACGAAVGLGAAFVMGRSMETLLYSVSPFDPLTVAAAATLLFAVALAASYVPARRAARSDPAHALRGE